MRKIADAAPEFPHLQTDRSHRRVENPVRARRHVVHKRLEDRGYEVFAVNPNATEIDGDPCYPDINSTPTA